MRCGNEERLDIPALFRVRLYHHCRREVRRGLGGLRMDFAELVKGLREYGDIWRDQLLYEAADAIEELSKRLDESIPKGDAEIIIAEVAKPRWISVTEGLPNENDVMLIYGEWTGASGIKYREIWLTDLKGFLHQGYKPIAWMPLPEPPKEETE